MVDFKRLKSYIVLAGYTQRKLVKEMCSRGVTISENTLSAKMTGQSQFYADEAVVICEILGIDKPEDRAAIFLT